MDGMGTAGIPVLDCLVLVSHFQLRRFWDSVNQQERCSKATVTPGQFQCVQPGPGFVPWLCPASGQGHCLSHVWQGVKVPSPAPEAPLDNAAVLFGHEIFSFKPQSAAGL